VTESNETIPGTAVVVYIRQMSWCSVNAAEILLVMECESGRQGTEHHRTHPGCIHCMVSSVVLLLSSVVSVAAPQPTRAAVYECLDAGGKPLLTNQPAQLHNCRMLSEGTHSEQKPSEVSTPPPVSPPPIISDDYTPSHVPSMPPNLPTPCARGVNPLNPLSTPPCIRSDQSGAQPPEVAPPPSP
jgi:hypothetical protein